MSKQKLIMCFILALGPVCAISDPFPMSASFENITISKDSLTDSPQLSNLKDLPLKIFDSSTSSNLPLLVYISGDGGLNSFSESLCMSLSQKGIPVVFLDAKKYFWRSKTPEETTASLTLIIETYLKIWKRDRFILTGFSFGASVVPFIVNRLSSDIKKEMWHALLISPDQTSDFEIHLSDMLNLGISRGKYDVIKEIHSIENHRLTAVFGSDESEEVRQSFRETGMRVEILQGNHHFDSNDQSLIDLIMNETNDK